MTPDSSNKNLHSTIFSQHGRESLLCLRKLEGTEKKLAAWQNHRHFNPRCLRSDLTPISLKLSSTVQGKASERVLKQTERKLLEIRTRQCKFTIDKLCEQKETLKSKLFETIKTKEEQDEISNFLAHAHKTTFETAKSRQRNKFEKLKDAQFRLDTATHQNNIQDRWVINKSSLTLNENTTELLKKGLNFAVTPKNVPTEDIITATELACKNLDGERAANLKSEITRAVKRRKKIKPNITVEEVRALQELRKNDSVMILPADKGRATVILDRSEYDSKITKILDDTKTYEKLSKDPTTTFKNKLINILKPWKKEESISKNLSRQLYPTSYQAPKFYGLPKIHKQDMPLRPIVSGIGSVSEGCAKHLSKLLNSVKGKNGHSIKNSADFVSKIKDLEVTPARKMVSFDVSALFTSIPVDFALKAIKKKFSLDPSWRSLTELDLEQVMTLLHFCLTTTYFVYKGTFYKQKFGAPMGSPISPGVADLAMEIFEEEMLSSCPDTLRPKVWYRYVDDTFTVLHEDDLEEFSAFLNARDPNIQFTSETETDGKLPFLDACVHLLEDGTLKTTVYRKPTHTDQYLNWHSNHHLDHKRSVVRSLLNRAETLVSDPSDREKEIEHIKNALRANGYKDWSFQIPNRKTNAETTTNQQTKDYNPPIALPYIEGLSEELQRIYKQHGVQVYHKPYNTLRSMLVKPKDKSLLSDKCGVIYQVSCSANGCDDFYIGETARSMGTRFKDHTGRDRESAVLAHVRNTGHSISLEDVNILVQNQPHYHSRKIREALEIHKAAPTLNKDQGAEVDPVLLQLLPKALPRSRDNNNSHVTWASRSRASSV